MTTIKVGVREFRERIASFLESDTPVAVTRRGETLGVYMDNFVFVLVKSPLGCSYDERIDSATCQSQNLSLANCYFASHSTCNIVAVLSSG
jgi:hypothetical protein